MVALYSTALAIYVEDSETNVANVVMAKMSIHHQISPGYMSKVAQRWPATLRADSIDGETANDVNGLRLLRRGWLVRARLRID